jgi:replicative DNA helicase
MSFAAESSTHLRVVPSTVDGARVPSHDLDAEGAVLSAVMIDPKAIAQLQDFLLPEHFYSEAHRQIYAAVMALHVDAKPIDIVMVGTVLKETDRIAQIGGMAYLTEVINAAPSVANVRAHATTIYECWRLRTAIAVMQRGAAEGYLDHGPLQEWLDRYVHDLASCAGKGLEGGGTESTIEAIRRILAARQQQDASPYRDKMGLRFGIPSLDALTGGLHGSHLHVLAAHPGVGKTTLALQIATNVSRDVMEAMLFSLEATRDELLVKIIARRARVDSERLEGSIDNGLTSAEWGRIMAVLPQLEEDLVGIRIDDTKGLHVDQIRQRAAAHSERCMALRKRPLAMVAIDYYQKLAPSPSMRHHDRRLQLVHASNALQEMAKKSRIAVLLLAQTQNKEKDKLTGIRPRPDAGSIADCKAPGKDADRMFFLHQEPLRRNGKVVGEDNTSVRCIVPKARGGRTGEVLLRLEGEFSNFVDAENDASLPMTNAAPPPEAYWDQFDPSHDRVGPDR